jgi:hypothetical protein
MIQPKALRLIPVCFALIITACVNAQTAAKVFERAKSAVVTISTPTGSGTGFIISDGKLLVTCYHVVAGERLSYLKTDLNGVKIVGILAMDKSSDIAILKIQGKVPKSLTLHSDGLMKPGTQIYVIGNPLGFLSQSISEGIVSGIRKTPSASLLQITAPVSEGSSGSPVLNPSGQVVGMVTSTIEEGQSLNFAVSASDVRRVKSAAERSRTQSRKDKVLGRLGQAVTATSIYSGPSTNSRVFYRVPAFEYLIIVPPIKKDWLRVLMEDDKIGYIKASAVDVQRLTVSRAPTSASKTSQLRTTGWPTGNARLADLSAKLGSKEFGDESARKLIQEGSKAVPFFIAAAFSVFRDHPEGKARAERGLIAIGKPAVEPLIKLLRDEDSDIRYGAAFLLWDLRDVRSVEPFIRLLSDKDDSVRRLAATVLGGLNDPRAVEPLIRSLGDENEEVRSRAASSLGELNDLHAVEPLIKLLTDSNWKVRLGAVKALGELKDKRAIAPLRALVVTEMITEVREFATKVIQEILEAK